MDCYDLVIVGAGAAGLAHAFFRHNARPDLRLLVVEGNARAGGWVHSEVREGFLCEAGPQGFRPNADTDTLLAALGFDGEVIAASAAAKRRWVLRDGAMMALPGGPLQFLTSPLFSLRDKLRICREPWQGRGADREESMAGFFTRRFGPATRPLAEALAHGIFAGDADRLEMRSMFPQAMALEDQHGSLLRGMLGRKRPRQTRKRVRRPALCTFRGGMKAAIDRLVQALDGAVALASPVMALARDGGGDGYRLVLGGPHARIVQARELVLAIPAPAAASLLTSLDAPLAAELRQIRAASVASVYVGAPRAQFAHALDGFGCLAPKQPSPLLGVLLCSSVFPGQAPADHALLRVMTGGVDHAGEVERSYGELCAQALTIVRDLFSLRGEPTFLHVERCRNAIAQYEAGHGQRLERIKARLAAHPGLSLLGASYRQIAVVGQWTAEGSHP